MASGINSIELDELVSLSSGKKSENIVPLNLNLVGNLSVEVFVNIGTAEMSLNKLFSLKSGDLLQLNEELNSPVTVIVNNAPIAKGILVAVDDHFGVKITEIAR